MKTMTYLLLAALVLIMQPMAMAIEEPDYQVIDSYKDFEVRRYSPYLVAEVDVSGDFSEAGNNAFRILADYIFGNNASASKMAMTAPVESRSAERGEKMAMTAPVIASGTDDSAGRHVWQYCCGVPITSGCMSSNLSNWLLPSAAAPAGCDIPAHGF